MVQKEVCIVAAVGARRVLSFDFTATPRAGVITYAQRKSASQVDVPLDMPPSFNLLQIYDQAGKLASADCTGIELLNNHFYGDIKQLIGGNARSAVMEDNRILPSGNIARPHAPVRSIYAWQQAHRKEINAAQLKRATARGW